MYCFSFMNGSIYIPFIFSVDWISFEKLLDVLCTVQYVLMGTTVTFF